MTSPTSDRVSMHGMAYPWAYEARVNGDIRRCLGRVKQARGGWEADDGEQFKLLRDARDYLIKRNDEVSHAF